MAKHLAIVAVALFMFACWQTKPSACGGCNGGVCGDQRRYLFTGTRVTGDSPFNTYGTVYPMVVGGTQTITAIVAADDTTPFDFRTSDGTLSIAAQSYETATVHGDAVGAGAIEVWSTSGKPKQLDSTTVRVVPLVSGATPAFTHVSSLPLALLFGDVVTVTQVLRGPDNQLAVDESLKVEGTNVSVTPFRWDQYQVIANQTGVANIVMTIGGVAQPPLALPVVNGLDAITTTNETALNAGNGIVGTQLPFCVYATASGYEVPTQIDVTVTGALWFDQANDNTTWRTVPSCYILYLQNQGTGTLHLSAAQRTRDYPFTVSFPGPHPDLTAAVDMSERD